MTDHDFGMLQKQGLRVIIDVHALDDDGETQFDQDTMMPVLSQAVDKALEAILTGSYATSIRVTRLVH